VVDVEKKCDYIVSFFLPSTYFHKLLIFCSYRLILRPGGVTLEQLRQVIPEMDVFRVTKETQSMVEKPATPGTSPRRLCCELLNSDTLIPSVGLKYRHYSPHAEVLLLEGENTSKTLQIVSDAFVHTSLSLPKSIPP